MVFLWIAAALIAVWVTFIYAPSLVMFRAIFLSRDLAAPTKQSLAATVLAPHTERILKDAAFLSSLSPERVSVKAADGAVLAGCLYKNGGNKTVIFFHGYSTHPMKNFAVHARLFFERGYDVILVFERAHGESGGKMGCMGLLERFDVPLWVAKAKELFPGSPVVLYGMSMGAATVAYASASVDAGDVAAMVLDCGFSSPYDQLSADTKRRKMPAGLLIPLIALHAKVFFHVDMRESAAKTLAKTSIPAFFMHGDCDRTVNIAQGLKNYEACASKKFFLKVPGAAHTAALLDGGKEAQDMMFGFIEDSAD